MRAVILSGGSVSDYDYIRGLIRPDDLIVCADRGYDHALALGVTPDAVVGDLDSAAAPVQGAAVLLRYPAEKDFTDTQLAYEWARGRGADAFLLLAATGTRLDHGLANILLLKRMLDRGERGQLIDEHNKVWLTDSALAVHEPAGALLSLLPLSDCSGVSLRGLRYPLEDAELRLGDARGVSNVITSSPAEVRVKNGLLLVIAARD